MTAWGIIAVAALAAAALIGARLFRSHGNRPGDAPAATISASAPTPPPSRPDRAGTSGSTAIIPPRNRPTAQSEGGQPAVQPGEPSNRRIGPFKLVRMLGCGGFASVYEAEDDQAGKHVALKLLHPHLTHNETVKGRFRGEARLMTRLHHPHIVAVHGEGETADGTIYLAMELLHGSLLSEIIGQSAPLPLPKTVAVVSQLASALDYLHASRIVHRDLKPSNVMMDGTGNVTLMDFGIARILDDEAHLTRTGELVGTPIYMAPEQISGDPVTAATDIYALGILAYELCAGRPPFVGRTPAVIRDQLDTPPPPIVQFNPDLPAPVAAAIESALAKDPNARPATAASFARRLGGDGAMGTAAAH